MKLTKEQASVVFAAVSFKDIAQQPRSFPISELKAAGNILYDLKLKCVDAEKQVFVEGELELGTSEKSLLIRCLDREWVAVDGPTVLSLKELLEA